MSAMPLPWFPSRYLRPEPEKQVNKVQFNVDSPRTALKSASDIANQLLSTEITRYIPFLTRASPVDTFVKVFTSGIGEKLVRVARLSKAIARLDVPSLNDLPKGALGFILEPGHRYDISLDGDVVFNLDSRDLDGKVPVMGGFHQFDVGPDYFNGRVKLVVVELDHTAYINWSTNDIDGYEIDPLSITDVVHASSYVTVASEYMPFSGVVRLNAVRTSADAGGHNMKMHNAPLYMTTSVEPVSTGKLYGYFPVFAENPSGTATLAMNSLGPTSYSTYFLRGAIDIFVQPPSGLVPTSEMVLMSSPSRPGDNDGVLATPVVEKQMSVNPTMAVRSVSVAPPPLPPPYYSRPPVATPASPRKF